MFSFLGYLSIQVVFDSNQIKSLLFNNNKKITEFIKKYKIWICYWYYSLMLINSKLSLKIKIYLNILDPLKFHFVDPFIKKIGIGTTQVTLYN